MMKKNSKTEIKQAIENLGDYAESLQKQNSDVSETLQNLSDTIQMNISWPMGVYWWISLHLREILDDFREHHSREENKNFD